MQYSYKKKSWRQTVKSLNGRDCKRYRVNALCQLFGVSKQAYYKEVKNNCELSAEREIGVVEFVRAERSLDEMIGCRKLWLIYNQYNSHQPISRSIFESVMTHHRLWLRQRKTTTRTTFSRHGLPVYPNLIYDVIPTAPCQIWVADITYVPIINADGTRRFCYLSIIMDAYSRYILGYCVGASLETIYSTMALNMAVENCHKLKLPLQGLIHHSDRGAQYASAEYTDLLKSLNIQISMTESGNPKDNPQAERINSTIKNELFGKKVFNSLEQIRVELPKRIEYYNYRRPHMSIGNLTPFRALSMTGDICKKWHSFRDDAIKDLKNGEPLAV